MTPQGPLREMGGATARRPLVCEVLGAQGTVHLPHSDPEGSRTRGDWACAFRSMEQGLVCVVGSSRAHRPHLQDAQAALLGCWLAHHCSCAAAALFCSRRAFWSLRRVLGGAAQGGRGRACCEVGRDCAAAPAALGFAGHQSRVECGEASCHLQVMFSFTENKRHRPSEPVRGPGSEGRASTQNQQPSI